MTKCTRSDELCILRSYQERLNLSTNSFISEVPAAVARLPALKSLILDTNNFTGSYPAAEISRLVGLESLTLAYNAFSPALCRWSLPS
jgi:Leucine-rich repeat (LRR) protein